MTWRELKEFCNSLPEKELEKNVIMWREEEGINNISAEQLEEDHYINPENCDDGCFPMWQAIDMIKDGPDEYPNGMNDFEKVYDKGHPILLEEL